MIMVKLLHGSVVDEAVFMDTMSIFAKDSGRESPLNSCLHYSFVAIPSTLIL